MTADGEFFEYEWWSYFLIPWIAGFVGYVTNVAALHMTFYPLEFWGIKIYRPKNQPWGIIGWQVRYVRASEERVLRLVAGLLWLASWLSLQAFHIYTFQAEEEHLTRWCAFPAGRLIAALHFDPSFPCSASFSDFNLVPNNPHTCTRVSSHRRLKKWRR